MHSLLQWEGSLYRKLGFLISMEGGMGCALGLPFILQHQ